MGAAFVLLGLPAAATDTAFWKPYEPDANTFFLEDFDATGGPEGRFGNAWQGPAAFKQAQPRLLAKPETMLLECWVKLDRLPERRAWLMRRAGETRKTIGFELFVEPNGEFGAAWAAMEGDRSELKSGAEKLAVGRWTHVAAIHNANNSNFYYRKLHLDGREIAKGPMRELGTGEATAAAVVVGEGVPGRVDEARVHLNIATLWPQPQHAWISAKGGQALPSLETVFAPGHAPLLHMPFDGADAPGLNRNGLKVKTTGSYVDGVRGQAIRGRVEISGPMCSAEAGAVEFWARPVGINNWSDRNRGLVNAGSFYCYIFNGGANPSPMAVLGKSVVGSSLDRNETHVYPGKWDHYLFTWGGGKLRWHINGKVAGAAETPKMLPLTRLECQPAFGDFDELYVYDKALSPVEAANAYWRYVDPSQLKTARAEVASLHFWHLPSTRELYVRITALEQQAPAAPVRLQVKDARGQQVFSAAAGFSANDQLFVLPDLAGGDYWVNLKVGDAATEPQLLKRQRFAWEGNTLGITDAVFPPFTPIKCRGQSVAVVMREYRLNDFGLWDSVKARGQFDNAAPRELLAAPMRFTAESQDGRELAWKGRVELMSRKPHLAVYRARAECPAVGLEAVSAIEPDGMMKVTLKLLPVKGAPALKRLSLEIPLRDEMAALMHEDTASLRLNYSGSLPSGEGEVWTSKQSKRYAQWLNAFTGYIWLGGPERGLAWFAENDKGWVTAKNHDAPLMRITRGSGRVTLRVDLVNVPGVIAAPTELVFGLQASPTRPVAADYRSKALTLGGVGLSVIPWGGYSCAWKSPWMDRWEVVDKVIEGRNEGRVDRAWFEAFEKEHNVPKRFGRPWSEDTIRFAGDKKPLTSPDPVYFEEMHVLTVIPEFHVFQDEWDKDRRAEREYASLEEGYRRAESYYNPAVRPTFCRSYQDYTLSLMNQWMRRGVSMYWDNTCPSQSYNPWVSAAYVMEDGRVQPGIHLWNQREYMRRTWNLMNYWRKKGVARPLEFVAHMTNAQHLPLFSWSTCNFDNELTPEWYGPQLNNVYNPGDPCQPGFILAEATGLQVGAYPYLVGNLSPCNLPPEALGDVRSEISSSRREWGMRMVHEIIRGGPQYYVLPTGLYDRTVYDFGYGTPAVKVWRYWDDQPAFSVDHPRVKGILLSRAKDGKLLLVLQSWVRGPVRAAVTISPQVIGFAVGRHVYDAFRNRHLKMDGGTFQVAFDFPFETGIYLIDNQPPAADVLFADRFDRWLNPGWDYLSSFVPVETGALRFAENRAPWCGAARVFKGLGLPDFSDAALEFSFRPERAPTGAADLLHARFPAHGMEWSRHGLSHSDVQGGVLLKARVDPAQGLLWEATARAENKTVTLDRGNSGPVDGRARRVRISSGADGRYTVTLDGQEVLAVPNAPVTSGNAFGIAAGNGIKEAVGAVYVDDVVLRAGKVDVARFEAQRAKAVAGAAALVTGGQDPLYKQVFETVGWHSSQKTYSLSYFSDPEKDAAQLARLLLDAKSPRERLMFLALLRELPSREAKHIAAMTQIGQKSELLPAFQRARAQTLERLSEPLEGADDAVRAAVAQTRAALEAGRKSE
jgi:hypothetical protein